MADNEGDESKKKMPKKHHHHHSESHGGGGGRAARRGRQGFAPAPKLMQPSLSDAKLDILRSFDPLSFIPDVEVGVASRGGGGEVGSKLEDSIKNSSSNCACQVDDNNSSDDESNADGGTRSSVGDENASPVSKAFSEVGLSGINPVSSEDQEDASLDASFHSSSSVGSLVDFSDGRDVGDETLENGGGGQAALAMMCSSMSVDTLTSDFSDGLKVLIT